MCRSPAWHPAPGRRRPTRPAAAGRPAQHVRPTSPAAAGQRFLGSGTFLWYRQIARILREKLPDEAAKVPVRTMPDIVVKLLARRNPQLAMLRPELGRTRLVDSSKARTQLGWHPRPTEQTITDTATALIAKNALAR